MSPLPDKIRVTSSQTLGDSRMKSLVWFLLLTITIVFVIVDQSGSTDGNNTIIPSINISILLRNIMRIAIILIFFYNTDDEIEASIERDSKLTIFFVEIQYSC